MAYHISNITDIFYVTENNNSCTHISLSIFAKDEYLHCKYEFEFALNITHRFLEN